MKRVAAFSFLLLGGFWQLSANDIAIGELELTAPNFGYQTVGFFNLTGATNGCEQLTTTYNVCNGVNVSSWQLQIDFTPNVGGLPTSPLIFNSSGVADIIAPTDANFDAYTGDASNPWTLSFDLVNSGCSPNCDANISEIIFSGMIDTNSLQLFNDANPPAGTPYVIDPLPSTSFVSTWIIPTSDYSVSPDSLFDTNTVTISDQAATGVPEPGSLFLALAGFAAGVWKRKSIFGRV